MITRSDAADRWRRIVRQQRASGLSVTAFCRRAGVPQSSLYAWRRKLRDEVVFAEVKLAREARSPVVAPQEGGSLAADMIPGSDGIELRLPGRRGIVVRPGFDRQTLVELLFVLEATSPDLGRRQANAAGVATRRARA